MDGGFKCKERPISWLGLLRRQAGHRSGRVFYTASVSTPGEGFSSTARRMGGWVKQPSHGVFPGAKARLHFPAARAFQQRHTRLELAGGVLVEILEQA